ncbi:glutaredoxin family protein [Bacillus albus]|uniref:glutaredoxin family protein n=1 Tax=Bacillus albus TaxID=2026189 RepID=UPI00101E9B0F|nr:glutaredoxin domain-containing protein [Bacillus albus]
MKIKMFTKTVCPTCKIAKQQLSYLPVSVEIEEINIEEDGTVIDIYGDEHTPEEYLVNVLDSMSTPTFEFEDGTVVRGFEVGPIMGKLGL